MTSQHVTHLPMLDECIESLNTGTLMVSHVVEHLFNPTELIFSRCKICQQLHPDCCFCINAAIFMIDILAWWLKDMAISVVGLGFDSQPDQTRPSVANGSPSLRRFFGAVLSRRQVAEIDPVPRYMLRGNTASIIKI